MVLGFALSLALGPPAFLFGVAPSLSDPPPLAHPKKSNDDTNEAQDGLACHVFVFFWAFPAGLASTSALCSAAVFLMFA